MRVRSIYKTTIGKKETLIEINRIKENLQHWIKSNFEVLEVDVPAFLPEDDIVHDEYSFLTRKVSFDILSSPNFMSELISPTNWMRQQMNNYGIEVNEGIYARSKHILRDVKTTPVQSNINELVTIQINIPSTIDKDNYKDDIVKKLWDFIYGQVVEISNRFTKHLNIFPDKLPLTKTQWMYNEFPEMSNEEKERQIVLEKNAVELIAPGEKLFSGEIHRQIHPYTYDLKRYSKILMINKTNSKAISVASIAILASGDVLSDQLSMYGRSDLKTTEFYNYFMDNTTSIIEIKIKMQDLFFAIFNKAHIAEVQTGTVFSFEGDSVEKLSLETF